MQFSTMCAYHLYGERIHLVIGVLYATNASAFSRSDSDGVGSPVLHPRILLKI
ncbi:unnamed protein product [Ixodes pacificus]